MAVNELFGDKVKVMANGKAMVRFE